MGGQVSGWIAANIGPIVVGLFAAVVGIVAYLVERRDRPWPAAASGDDSDG